LGYIRFLTDAFDSWIDLGFELGRLLGVEFGVAEEGRVELGVFFLDVRIASATVNHIVACGILLLLLILDLRCVGTVYISFVLEYRFLGTILFIIHYLVVCGTIGVGVRGIIGFSVVEQ